MLKAEIISRAATELGILELGQTLPAQDNTRIGEAYDEVYDELKEEGLATWASDSEVPDKLIPYVSALMELNCLSTYSASIERFNRIISRTGLDGELAKKQIRKMIVPAYESLDEPTDY